MRPDPFSDPGDDGQEPDRSLPPAEPEPSAGAEPAQQGLFLCLRAAGPVRPVIDVTELADAIVGLAETLGVAGLAGWGSPGFGAALDQVKAGATEQILACCPMHAVKPTRKPRCRTGSLTP